MLKTGRVRQGGEEDSFTPSKKRKPTTDEEEDEEFTVEDEDEDTAASPSHGSGRRKSKRARKAKTPYDPGSPSGGHKALTASGNLAFSGGSSTGLYAGTAVGNGVVASSNSASEGFQEAPNNVTQAHAGMILEADMRDCFECLAEMMEQPKAYPFLEPVDYVALGLPTYPQIVKIPMDLGTIKQMLIHNTLANPAHFAEHVRLVFKNAMDFNVPQSGIYLNAEELLQEFEAKYKAMYDRWLSQPSEEKPANGESTKQNEEIMQIEKLQSSVDSNKLSIESLKKQIEEIKHNLKKPKWRRIRLSTPKYPLSYKEKEDLCARITQLPQKDLPGLLEMVQKSDGTSSNSAGEEGEFEIDIDHLDILTLFEVKQYVEERTPPTKPNPSGKRGGPRGRARGQGPLPPAAMQRKEPSEENIAKLAMAQNQTKARINEIQRQIQGVEKSKSLAIDRIVAINPSDEREGFWIGRIASIPENGNVQVQWYELKNKESLDNFNSKTGGDVRYYEKGEQFDQISVHTIFISVEVKLTWDSEKQLWVLSNAREVMSQAKRHGEFDLHDLEIREAEAKMKASS